MLFGEKQRKVVNSEHASLREAGAESPNEWREPDKLEWNVRIQELITQSQGKRSLSGILRSRLGNLIETIGETRHLLSRGLPCGERNEDNHLGRLS
jgi:hypothetical protein